MFSSSDIFRCWGFFAYPVARAQVFPLADGESAFCENVTQLMGGLDVLHFDKMVYLQPLKHPIERYTMRARQVTHLQTAPFATKFKHRLVIFMDFHACPTRRRYSCRFN